MGQAVFVMKDGKLYTATITMTVNFLAPAKPGPIVGEATVTQLKTIAFVEGRLMAEDGRVLATATTSLRLSRPRRFFGSDFPTSSIVIACDKREAFAHGSVSDEAIHLSVMPRYGLLRFARNDGKLAIAEAMSRSAAWR